MAASYNQTVYSDHDFDNAWEEANRSMDVILYSKAGLLLLITVIGLVMNALLAIVIFTRQSLRKETLIAVAVLALVDFFRCFNQFFLVIEMFIRSWTFGDGGCKFLRYIHNAVAYYSVYELMVVCFIRFAFTLAPHQILRSVATRFQPLIHVIGCLVVFIGFVPLALQYREEVRVIHNKTHVWCVYDYPSGSIVTILYIYDTFWIGIPLSIMTIFAIATYVKLRTAPTHLLEDGEIDESESKRVLVVSLLTPVFYAIMEIPGSIFNKVAIVYGSGSHAAIMLINILIYIAVLINPCLQGLTIPSVRQAIKESIQCKYRKDGSNVADHTSVTSTVHFSKDPVVPY